MKGMYGMKLWKVRFCDGRLDTVTARNIDEACRICNRPIDRIWMIACVL